MEEQGIWKENAQVTAHMVDAKRNIRITALATLMQEIAGRHAKFCKAGYYEMKEAGFFWGLSRILIQVERLPIWEDNVYLQTWVSSVRGPFSHRNFSIQNKQGEDLVLGCSLWALINTETRKPVRIQNFAIPVLEDLPPKCGLPEKVPAIISPYATNSYQIKYSDVDMIGHSNNVKYLEWILDHASISPIQQKPKQITLNYLKETGLGDTLEIRQTTPTAEPISYFELYAPANESIACRAKIIW